MADLFTPEGTSASVRIELPGASLLYNAGFIDSEEADELFRSLLEQTDWQEKEVFVWGKWHKQPRLVAWYGDSGTEYVYSGSSNSPLPWTPLLQKIRQRVEAAGSAQFNSVLLNLYRDQNDRMGWHSDNERELGSIPTIASISLGCPRELLFKHHTIKELGTRRILLAHGSLLVMAGDTQKNWLHAINKESKPLGKRINLTFRRVIKIDGRAS